MRHGLPTFPNAVIMVDLGSGPNAYIASPDLVLTPSVREDREVDIIYILQERTRR